MSDYAKGALVVLALIGVFIFGFAFGMDAPGHDCDLLGKFRAGKTVYSCSRIDQ